MGGKGASQPQSEFQTGFDQWKAGQSGAGQEPSGEQGGAASYGAPSEGSTQNPDAAKNALIGAGIGGMLFGPVGTLVGGALGYYGSGDMKTVGGSGEYAPHEGFPVDNPDAMSFPGRDPEIRSTGGYKDPYNNPLAFSEDELSLLGGDEDDTQSSTSADLDSFSF